VIGNEKKVAFGQLAGGLLEGIDGGNCYFSKLSQSKRSNRRVSQVTIFAIFRSFLN